MPRLPQSKLIQKAPKKALVADMTDLKKKKISKLSAVVKDEGTMKKK